MKEEQKISFKKTLKETSTPQLVRQIQKAIAYLHFNQDENKKELFRLMEVELWNRGIPLSNIPNEHHAWADDLTEWEFKYIIR